MHTHIITRTDPDHQDQLQKSSCKDHLSNPYFGLNFKKTKEQDLTSTSNNKRRKLRRELFPPKTRAQILEKLNTQEWLRDQIDSQFKKFCDTYGLDEKGEPIESDIQG